MEREFIPVEVAKNQIIRMEKDMKQMYERHMALIEEMDKNYRLIEFKTQEHFTEFLEKWRASAKAKIEQYKTAFNELKVEKETIQMELQPVLVQLKSENKNLKREHEELLAKYNEDLEMKKKEHKEKEEVLGSKYQEELAKLKQDNLEMKELLDSMRTERRTYEERTQESLQKMKEKFYMAKETAKDVTKNYIEDCAALVVKEVVNEVEKNISKQGAFELTRTYKLNINKLKKALQEQKTTANVEIEQLKQTVGELKQDRESDDLTETATLNQTINQVKRNDSNKYNATNNSFVEDINKYDNLLADREKINKKIRSWKRDFQIREKRKCTKEDCKPINNLYEQLKELNRQIRTFKGKENEVLFLESDDEQSFIESMIVENEALKKELEELRSTLLGKVTKDKVVNQLEKQIESLKKAKEQVDVKLKEALADCTNYEIQFNDVSEKLKQIQNKKSELKDKLITHIDSGAEDKGGSIEYKNELEALKKKLKTIEQEYAKLKSKASHKDKNTAKIVPVTNTQEADIKQLEDNLAAKDKLIEELKQKLHNGKDNAELSKVKEELKKLKESNQAQDQIEKLKAEHALAIAAHDKTTSEKLNELLKEIGIHKGTIGKLTEENNNMKDEITKLEKKSTILSENIKRLEAEKVKIGDVYTKNKTLEEEVDKLKTQLGQLKTDYTEMENKYKDSMTQRKKLHNIIEDIKGKIRVYCRVRPISQEEIKKGSTSIVNITDEFTLKVDTRNGPKAFTFDSVFGPGSTQEKVFEDTKRLIQSAVDGYNVCIFAYGQTGAGKSFTIQGNASNPGIAPRSFKELYRILSGMNNYTYKVECYMIELYLDSLSDLLLPKNQKKDAQHLDIKEDVKGMIYIQGATKREINNADDLMNKLEIGLNERKTSATDMNANSSRSHLVFSILVECVNKQTSQRTLGKISFVDLAGSERADKAGTSAERLKEGRAINKSLTELGNVIMALSSGSKFINKNRR